MRQPAMGLGLFNPVIDGANPSLLHHCRPTKRRDRVTPGFRKVFGLVLRHRQRRQPLGGLVFSSQALEVSYALDRPGQAVHFRPDTANR